MALYELHFPLHVAQEYLDHSINIFDAPPIFGVDEFCKPYALDVFAEIYYFARRKLVGYRIPKDISVFHYENGVSKEYEVTCTLRKGYQIDRLVTMHSILTYRHPITTFAQGLFKDLDKFGSLYSLREAFDMLKKLNVTFSLVGSGDKSWKRLKVLVHHSVKAMASMANYYSPFSLSSQLVYALARFIADHGLINESICVDLKTECDYYEKQCSEAFERIRKELESILYTDKLQKAAEFVLAYTPFSNGRLTLPLEIKELVSEFNQTHGCDLSVDAVVGRIQKLYSLGKVYHDGERWRVRE